MTEMLSMSNNAPLFVGMMLLTRRLPNPGPACKFQ